MELEERENKWFHPRCTPRTCAIQRVAARGNDIKTCLVYSCFIRRVDRGTRQNDGDLVAKLERIGIQEPNVRISFQ